jgi:tetratricopeptide (TPR) repeat protein
MDLIERIKILHNFLSIGNHKSAIEGAKKILKKVPNNSYVWNLCGLAHQQTANHQAAIDCFTKAIYYESNNFAAKNNLASSFKSIGKFDKSEQLFLEILEVKPDYVQALHNFANLKKQLMDYDGAIKFFKLALKQDKNNKLIRYNLASTLQGVGNYNDSKKIIKEILKDDPKFVPAHKTLSELKKYEADDVHISEMKNLLEDKEIEDIKKIDLYFSLGKAYEDMKNFDLSFDYLKKGNEIKKSFLSYNVEKDLKTFAEIKEAFKTINFDEYKVDYSDSKRIIFICGMPRSGTTLVEQIVSTHKLVYGAGELMYLAQAIFENLTDKNDSNNYLKLNINKIFEELKLSTNNNVKKFYNEKLNSHKSDLNFVTDKAPQNFKWIGIMKLFFPNCRVIHCNRNAKDNCLSLYKNQFPSKTMNWAFDQEDIGRYYNGYRDLMNFWKTKVPNFIYDLNYEKLVENQEEEIINLIKFCGLEWDIDCLKFYEKNKTPIKTVSVNQARKPIYSNSINSSEFYSNKLSTLFKLVDQS